MNDLIRRSDAMAFQNEVEPIFCKSPITGDVFSASKDGDLVAYLDHIPAVYAVEVRHGHWVTEEEAIEKDDYSLRYTCSVCGHCDWDCTESESFNFCPNCGAKMDGEDGDV